MVNEFTDQDLQLNRSSSLESMWREKDALEHVINRLEEYKERYGEL